MTQLTAVIPVFNEAESLRTLHGELSAVAARERYDLRIVFVDDGSTDASWQRIEELAASDDRVLGIRFRRNFGKAAALSAGFDAAEAPLIVTLDADLQDDPAEIPCFLAKMDQGFDVVSGWKQTRHDPWHKVIPSRIFNWLVSRMTGVKLHDHNCGLKCYRRDVILEVRLYGELHRFVPVLAAARGFRVAEVIVNHRPRKFGKSKYGVARFAKGLLDLLTVKFITGFGHRPQHVLGVIGLIAFLFGFIGLSYLAGYWVISRLADSIVDIHLHQKALLYYSLGALLVGAQFVSMGLLGEMITAFLARDIDTYSVADTTTHERTTQDRASSASRRP